MASCGALATAASLALLARWASAARVVPDTGASPPALGGSPSSFLRLNHTGGARTPCESKQCLYWAKYLKDFLDTSKDPCKDFAAYTCSAKKKLAFKQKCDKCKGRPRSCLSGCRDDKSALATMSRLGVMMTVGKAVGNPSGKPPVKPAPKDYLGEGMAPLVGAVRMAYDVCKQKPARGKDPLLGSFVPAAEGLLASLGAEALEDFVMAAGRAEEPQRAEGILGVAATYHNPLFGLWTGLDEAKPSDGVKVVLYPVACAEMKGLEPDELGFTMQVVSKLKKELLPGGASPEEAKAAYVEFMSPLFKGLAQECSGLFGAMDKDGFKKLPTSVPIHELQGRVDALAGGALGLDLQAVLLKMGVPRGVSVHIHGGEEQLAAWAKQVAPLLAQARASAAFAFAAVEGLVLDLSDHFEGGANPNACMGAIKAMFPWLIARKYAADVLTEKAAAEGTEAAWAVVAAFADNLADLPWISQETARAAKQKLRKIRVKIGAPKWISNDQMLTRHYGFAFDFSPEMSWAQISSSAGFANFQRIAEGVARPKDWESHWVTTPDTFNMMYNEVANDIVGFAAFMQKPIFDPAAPAAFNFGVYGHVIGHELTHAFDSDGAKRGPWGDLHNWWSEESLEHFKKQQACFVEQYSSYPLRGDKANGEPDDEVLYDDGKKCLAENIADSGGLGLAHLAYRHWVEKHGEEPPLKGLEEFTPDQLFFLRFGANMCGYQTSKGLKAGIKSEDDHARDPMRLVGAVQNSRSFARAFGCAAGDRSTMNPTEKCEIWGIE
mmetsp:Transcript_104141/g.335800  ORF Transcript_104141/g.335800 Transcript_104141/m.335800 type:complete len:777 (-) Transcript_104141:81-2411(-)